MSSLIDNLSPKEWESYCEIMLRHHYGAKNFWPVPDEDSGDLGLEFYTVDGTIYQCYYPDNNIDMATYKQRIQKKIREDLKKLKSNEEKIAKMIDDVIINQWVLLTPKNRSKDLITYCNKKKREVLKQGISYINEKEFIVKIETADSYPDAKMYASGVYDKSINIPITQVSEQEKKLWKESNSTFLDNIVHKSTKIMGKNSDAFQDNIITK
ncbi:hypothetical protein [Grimontia marina]|uniref:Uncharacterized protein n=1 Tax=Grimontia marina TaxID=646534 RepID=A0A128FJ71_9GAMM|nr:hypothetical protein [Grimontia marina]CZF86828.1 hypothetical protein GMA8713_04867 [Grimontia marina]